MYYIYLSLFLILLIPIILILLKERKDLNIIDNNLINENFKDIRNDYYENNYENIDSDHILKNNNITLKVNNNRKSVLNDETQLKYIEELQNAADELATLMRSSERSNSKKFEIISNQSSSSNKEKIEKKSIQLIEKINKEEQISSILGEELFNEINTIDNELTNLENIVDEMENKLSTLDDLSIKVDTEKVFEAA